MGFDRRTFLQYLSHLGVTIGTSAIAPPSWATTLNSAVPPNLGRKSKRKLALLVGVDQYPHQLSLSGCTTDVQLQSELLIHRLGFASSDVLTLTNQQATREAIETAFTEHLVKQAQPGDQVVFHFSGYGTQVHLPPQGDGMGQWVNALLPQDGDSVAGVSNCLLEKTLLLLVRSLATRNSTIVLDTDYKSFGQSWPGCWRSRSSPDLTVMQPSQAELAFAQQLQLNRPRKLTNEQLGWSIVPATLISGAEAVEGQWQGFTAGLLTALLTQWLWSVTTPTTRILTVTRLKETLGARAHEQPFVTPDNPSQQTILPQTQNPLTAWGSEGYLTRINPEGTAATLSLLGLKPDVWSDYGLRSQFQVLDAAGQVQGRLALRSKSGLQAQATIIEATDTLAPQQFVQEWVRCLPRNLGLTIALDKGLQRIERVDATSTLSTVSTVNTVILAGDQPADYLFAKRNVSRPVSVASTTPVPTAAGYGLFSAGGLPIPNTAGNADEAVIVALNRITPTFNGLLASKWWRLLTNETSSQLPARVTLELLQNPQPLTMACHYSRRCFPNQSAVDVPIPRSVPLGAMLRLKLENPNDFPLYALVLTVDSRGIPSTFVGENLPLTQPHLAIAPSSTKTLPNSSATRPTGMMVRSPGLAQIYVLLSRTPWIEATQVLTQTAQGETTHNKLLELSRPLKFTQALLTDLHQASVDWGKLANPNPDHYSLHNQVWVGFNVVYTVA